MIAVKDAPSIEFDEQNLIVRFDRFNIAAYSLFRRIPSNKPAVVADAIAEQVREGRKTLVWTQFDAETAIIAEELRKRGIGSTAYVALGGSCLDGRLAEPRNVIGFELKESYHDQSLRNVEKLRREQTGGMAEQKSLGLAEVG